MSGLLYNSGDILRFLASARAPLIVILGPTASGKTAFSLDCARLLCENGLHAEIVSADSRQLYRFLDIGTAKIRPEEMQGIPHHLLSVLDPKDPVTIAWYQEHAIRIIREIHQRGGIPLLVGGSMLYLSAVIDGLRPLSPVDPVLRCSLEAAYDRDHGAALYAELRRIDPETASAFSPVNKAYLIRAMEIERSTGLLPSRAKQRGDVPFDLFILGVRKSPADLHDAIAKRIQAMMDAGWIGEVEALLHRGYTAKDPGLLSHGYREIAAMLLTGKPARGELPEIIAAQTRQYAKRQRTWWKNDPRIYWMGTATREVIKQ